MISKLKNIFPSLVTDPVNYGNLSIHYKWFITEENKVIGIHKNDLTSKNREILTAFLTPLNINIPLPTEEELKWQELINNSTASISIRLENTFRFVFFSISNPQIEPMSFYEAIQELFNKQVPIIWHNEREGIIIEKQSIADDPISYKQIIDLLMSDLYVKINFFIGPSKNNLTDIHKSYNILAQAAKIAFIHSKKTVITYVDSIPYILIDQISPDLRSALSSTILKEMIDDKEILKTIEIFFECNLNVTVTAKKMYMHRNSVQYRIDKFINKTGINIQQFDQALTVYLVLLAR